MGLQSFSTVFSASLTQPLTRSGIDGNHKPVTERLELGMVVKNTDF